MTRRETFASKILDRRVVAIVWDEDGPDGRDDWSLHVARLQMDDGSIINFYGHAEGDERVSVTYEAPTPEAG